MDKYEAFNWFARESRDVADGVRDITVLPKFLKGLTVDQLEQRLKVADLAFDDEFSSDVDTPMVIYRAGLRTEFKKRTPPRSVFLMEDWSPGQYYIFDYPAAGQKAYLETLLQAAHEALDTYPYLLSAWGKEVAETLAARIPPFLATIKPKLPSEPKSKKPRAGFVYLVQSPTGAYKIGRTKNPDNRMATFGVLLPFEVEYVCLIATEDMHTLERELQGKYSNKNIRGEWFSLTPEDVDYMKGLANV